MECFFCQKLTHLHQLPDEEVVWQFRHSVALLGPWQYYQGYCILVARTHAVELSRLPLTERIGFFDEMCQLAQVLEHAFQPRKLNYELLGNQVPHLHWHLFPRQASDPETLKPVWLALDRAEGDQLERVRLQQGPVSRRETTELIRQRLRQS